MEQGLKNILQRETLKENENVIFSIPETQSTPYDNN